MRASITLERLSSLHNAPVAEAIMTVATPENKSTAGSPAIWLYFSGIAFAPLTALLLLAALLLLNLALRHLAMHPSHHAAI